MWYGLKKSGGNCLILMPIFCNFTGYILFYLNVIYIGNICNIVFYYISARLNILIWNGFWLCCGCCTQSVSLIINLSLTPCLLKMVIVPLWWHSWSVYHAHCYQWLTLILRCFYCNKYPFTLYSICLWQWKTR